jgi:hypothetical protein
MDTCHEQTFHVSLTHASLTHACGWIEKARLRSVTVYDQQPHLMEVSGLKNLGFIEIRKDAAHPVVWPRKKETPRHARNANPANNRSAHPNQLPIQSTSKFQHYKVVCAHASSLPVPLSLSLSLSHIHHLPSNHNSKRHSSNERYSTRSRDGTGTASFGSAAGTVVFDAVHLRGDLEDGPWGW